MMSCVGIVFYFGAYETSSLGTEFWLRKSENLDYHP